MAEAKDSPHITSIKNQWQLNKRATEKKARFVGGALEIYKGPALAQDLETVLASTRANEKSRQLANAETGQKIDNGGIFLCIWEPKDETGNSLGKYFVYAAPEDLTDVSGKRGLFTYGNAIERIAGLENWHGFNGANYKTANDFYKALTSDRYDGGWIIPPSELLMGKNARGSQVHPDNLYVHREKGDLSGTFTMVAAHDLTDAPDWYWSSTETRNNPDYVLSIQLSYPGNSSDSKDGTRLLGCRPIRLEPAL